ncbi:hypothetical protein I4U23_008726 [Adineta vaga]|nr:hypothetical protein I4U23_008726 [Adineta vaga]
MSISESFVRIESWLSNNAPTLLRQLNKPGSSIPELDKAESILGAKFPPSVREAYTHYDGESSESTGLFGSWRWLPLREIIEWNDEQKQNVQKYHLIDFKPSFMIPLLELTTTNNDLRYVETSGDDGQEETPVIEWNHTRPVRDIKYGSFANYLSTFAERLELGEYKCDNHDPTKARGLVLKH